MLFLIDYLFTDLNIWLFVATTLKPQSIYSLNIQITCSSGGSQAGSQRLHHKRNQQYVIHSWKSISGQSTRNTKRSLTANSSVKMERSLPKHVTVVASPQDIEWYSYDALLFLAQPHNRRRIAVKCEDRRSGVARHILRPP